MVIIYFEPLILLRKITFRLLILIIGFMSYELIEKLYNIEIDSHIIMIGLVNIRREEHKYFITKSFFFKFSSSSFEGSSRFYMGPFLFILYISEKVHK